MFLIQMNVCVVQEHFQLKKERKVNMNSQIKGEVWSHKNILTRHLFFIEAPVPRQYHACTTPGK
jgi:hypothetical protein